MQSKLATWLRTATNTMLRHMAFLGPGLIAAVAYCDPGNWATDMQAGSQFGYKLLFVVLLSGLFAVLLQILCCRLGAVTGQDLSVQTRRLVLGLDNEESTSPPMTRALRIRYWAVLIPLYIVNEIAIIATELAELIGSAIALNLLFPALPLWGGVLITTADVFLILVLYRPSTGVRLFEALIGVLVIIVLVCFCVLLERVQPNWGPVFDGYLPSKTVFSSQGLYVSISILGATIMPHSLVLGSHFATIDRLDGNIDGNAAFEGGSDEDELAAPATGRRTRQSLWRRLLASNLKVPEMLPDNEPIKRQPVSLRYMNVTLSHASWDIALCLVLFAITINSAILIVAAAAFYYGHNNNGETEIVADLFQAFHLLRDTTGKAPAILFAIALLSAGQSSSITVTLAGQIISEGFVHWRLTPFMRRLITRAIAVIPSMVVASIAGRDGLDTMLIASQVALSMALPFVSFPLLVVTCSPKRMLRLILPEEHDDHDAENSATKPPALRTSYGTVENGSMGAEAATSRASEVREAPAEQSLARCAGRCWRSIYAICWPDRWRTDTAGRRLYTFHSALPVAILAWIVFLVICVADVYVLISTLRDPSSA